VYQNIYLVGAFDRHNYGDILFPLIHTNILLSAGIRPEQIQYAAVSQSDMSAMGGYETISVKNLLSKNLDENTLIVLCGGDILSADWLLMLGNLSSPWVNKAFRIGRRLLGVDISNICAKILLKQINLYPYVIGKRDTQASVVYTAVGGAGFGGNHRHLKNVVDILSTCQGVSVRDNDVRSLLSRFGLSARLVPDTALPMSRIYPLEKLRERDWQSQTEFSADFKFDKYYSFQGAKRLLSGDISSIVEQIERVYRKTGYAPLFVPIGRAADHEDHIPLRKIFDALQSKGCACAFLNSEHVLDIMASLAFAHCYIGTSLHGAITTYSFGKKVVAIQSSNVPKLKDFLNTWVNPGDFYLSDSCVFESQLVDILTLNTHFHSEIQLSLQIEQVVAEVAGRHTHAH
jgi:hypothetical protein